MKQILMETDAFLQINQIHELSKVHYAKVQQILADLEVELDEGSFGHGFMTAFRLISDTIKSNA